MKIKIGIAGYGNIGKGVEKAISASPDMELAAVFTRRDPGKLQIETPGIPVCALEEAESEKNNIDVMVLCGGSAKDLPEQGPKFAGMFNIVDSFDTHAKIPGYFLEVDKAAICKTAIISAGWDPGLFSMIRMMSQAILPDGKSYTFWGRGVSQGHSYAIRKIEGVKNAVQYTVPIEDAVNAAKSGANPELSARQKMKRECYVVADDGADTKKIEEEIKTMPDYFADYDTSVNFITEQELENNHSKMPHGGFALHSGSTGENKHFIEFSLKLDSNPEFTGSVLAAYARAAARMAKEGNFGAKTVFDVPLSYLSPKENSALIAELL
ncbi:MAG: diaminopimelate dehydrogenase [Oscillospiraceae bacterium]|nr:diaminopimelate dehydrogenase [Oscillospiraceae bacterium]